MIFVLFVLGFTLKLFESLIISSEYDPYSIIERLSPYLEGSASIVVHSPSAQVGL